MLNEFKIVYRTADKKDEKPKPAKFTKPEATFSQASFPISNAVDDNPATGWAISPQLGTDHAALFHTAIDAKAGLAITITLDQRYGSNHTLGKFRVSYTTDKNPKLAATLSKEMAKLLETPSADRTLKQKGELRKRYLAQDAEFTRLKMDADRTPPSDPRVLGAQDLTWALINSPAFLFNH